VSILMLIKQISLLCLCLNPFFNIWVYSGDPEFPGDVEESYRRPYPSDDAFFAEHSITLNVAAPDLKTVAPKDVRGCINWGTLKVNYNGTKRVRKGWSKNESVGWMESCWEVVLEEDDTRDAWLVPNGNSVGASAVLDDNGQPFLVFDWSHAAGCHSS